ncbi:uncharacterized protein IWZ02DRAFT_487247 [Phyllosticta citriasiana]|uniref:uncharacterized protein n=1 Tax=Phyllosticta citriasiana TaxID=595635 RepID=UPI0030FDA9F8
MRAFLHLLLLLLTLVAFAFAQGPTSSGTATGATTTGGTKTAETTTAATTATGTTTSEESSATTTATSKTDSKSTDTATSSYRPSDLPTLAGASIPTITVPNLANAPFMQKSDYPEGTVFIAVGAILGLFAATILAWRGMLAWSLHRSVKKAAVAHSVTDSKTMRGPTSTLYNSKGNGTSYNPVSGGSALNLGDMKSNKASALEKTRMVPSEASLFFSPTADGPTRTHGANRSSAYLPSGYYNSGHRDSSAPRTHSALGTPRVPSHYFTPSPPESPGLPPTSRDGPPQEPRSPLGGSPYLYGQPFHGSHAMDRSSIHGTAGLGLSSSSLNLAAPRQGRTPSAYLEDLFEGSPGVRPGGGGTGTTASGSPYRQSARRHSRHRSSSSRR